tara:strand:+ start:534 stop:1028 length:495 start_codon:yes stop_codon:yes gene_type:complete
MAAGGLPLDYMKDKNLNEPQQSFPINSMQAALDAEAERAAAERAAADKAAAKARAIEDAKRVSREKYPEMDGINLRTKRFGSLPSFGRSNTVGRDSAPTVSVREGGKKRRKRKTVKKLKKRKLKAGKSKKARISLNSITRRARSLRYRSRYNRGSTRTIRTKKR